MHHSCNIPLSSAAFMRNAFRSSSTRLRPRAMKLSNRVVKAAIRSLSSSNPKSTDGRLSAIEIASPYCAGPIDAPKRLGVMGAAIMCVAMLLSWILYTELRARCCVDVNKAIAQCGSPVTRLAHDLVRHHTRGLLYHRTCMHVLFIHSATCRTMPSLASQATRKLDDVQQRYRTLLHDLGLRTMVLDDHDRPTLLTNDDHRVRALFISGRSFWTETCSHAD